MAVPHGFLFFFWFGSQRFVDCGRRDSTPTLFPLSSSLIYLSTKPTPCRPARELWHRHFADILFALDIDIVIVIAIGIVIVLVTLFPSPLL